MLNSSSRDPFIPCISIFKSLASANRAAIIESSVSSTGSSLVLLQTQCAECASVRARLFSVKIDKLNWKKSFRQRTLCINKIEYTRWGNCPWFEDNRRFFGRFDRFARCSKWRWPTTTWSYKKNLFTLSSTSRVSWTRRNIYAVFCHDDERNAERVKKVKQQ